MTTYCWKCPACGLTTEAPAGYRATCSVGHTHMPMMRDYRAENAAPQTLQLKREREAGGRRAMRDLFLPVAKDFESATDQDGEKGLRAWADETKPKDGNKKPLWPDMKRKVF